MGSFSGESREVERTSRRHNCKDHSTDCVTDMGLPVQTDDHKDTDHCVLKNRELPYYHLASGRGEVQTQIWLPLTRPWKLAASVLLQEPSGTTTNRSSGYPS